MPHRQNFENLSPTGCRWRSHLLDDRLHRPAGGTVGAERDKTIAIAVINRPQCRAVRFRNRQMINGVPAEKREMALRDFRGNVIEPAPAAEKKHEPV